MSLKTDAEKSGKARESVFHTLSLSLSPRKEEWEWEQAGGGRGGEVGETKTTECGKMRDCVL